MQKISKFVNFLKSVFVSGTVYGFEVCSKHIDFKQISSYILHAILVPELTYVKITVLLVVSPSLCIIIIAHTCLHGFHKIAN